MIKSTKTTLKFANSKKLNDLNSFISEYIKVVSQFVDLLWFEDSVPSLIPKKYTTQVKSWLSARAIQCAAKQAAAIVRGTKTKQQRRLYQINKLKQLGYHKKARKLQVIYNKNNISKPNITNVDCELDTRFVKINLDNKTTFDGWVTLSCLGNKMKLILPFKKHDHFNKMLRLGKIKNGIRLSRNDITFNFDIKDPVKRSQGKILGIDIGQKTTLSCSDGQSLDKDPHGHTYKSICERLARKKKGSINFKQTEKLRTNYLHYIVNKLNLDNVKIVNRENIRDLRKFKNVSRKLKHWNYGELFDVLDNKLNEYGVHINKVSPTYTSQRCSSCGWVRKGNRIGKKFKCDKCGYTCDADLNASNNISLNLVPIGNKERLQHFNRKCFYWNIVSEESIVPHAQETNCHKRQ